MTNFTKTTYDNLFLDYFRRFKEIAPPRMLEYGGYFTGKPSAMASSLESLIAFANRVENPEDSVILDAGAGASSWILRSLFPHVVSTDPDAEYLEVVKKVCASQHLNTEGFIPLLENVHCTVDYTYYDYGNAERQPNMRNAIALTRVLIYLDDTDDRPDCAKDRAHIYKLASDLGLKIEDCREANDQYGRWGVIITTKS
jgi:hypothetical protein